jgi:hypothetical protein
MEDVLSNKIREIATEKMCDVMDNKLSMEDFETIIHTYIDTIQKFSDDPNYSFDDFRNEIVTKRKKANIPVDDTEMIMLNSALDQTAAYLEDDNVG